MHLRLSSTSGKSGSLYGFNFYRCKETLTYSLFLFSLLQLSFLPQLLQPFFLPRPMPFVFQLKHKIYKHRPLIWSVTFGFSPFLCFGFSLRLCCCFSSCFSFCILYGFFLRFNFSLFTGSLISRGLYEVFIDDWRREWFGWKVANNYIAITSCWTARFFCSACFDRFKPFIIRATGCILFLFKGSFLNFLNMLHHFYFISYKLSVFDKLLITLKLYLITILCPVLQGIFCSFFQVRFSASISVGEPVIVLYTTLGFKAWINEIRHD